MDSHDRRVALLDILARDGRIEVGTAAGELNASAATIRRDLDALARRNLLARTRGGAAPAEVAYDLPLRYSAARDAAVKRRIGAAAAALVAPGSVVGISGGTTTSEVARALADGSGAAADQAAEPPGTTSPVSAGTRLTVVTNALNIAAELAVRRTVKLVVTGGVARTESYELIGSFAEQTLDRLHLDVAVLGADGVDPIAGATARDDAEAAVTGLMATRADRVIIVADASKLGRTAFAQVCALGADSTLVTEADADPIVLDTFRRIGVAVVEA